jgi:hypothetical protein
MIAGAGATFVERVHVMRRINAYEIYTLAESLKEIEGFEATDKVFDRLLPLAMARIHLQDLLIGNPVPITITRQAALDLQNTINTWLSGEVLADQKSILGVIQVANLKSSLATFNTVLNAELANLDTYWVEPKGIYSTNDLIESAENTFSEKVRAKLTSETRLDINEAGRCLAFDLPTAAAFHIWRVAERELRAYYQTWLGKPAGKKDWSKLLQELKDTPADPKVNGVLDHLWSLHRNPTMHPEDSLNLDDAVGLFGIANSAISAMKNDAPAPQPETGSDEPQLGQSS